jgi:hypothetical protein
MKKAWIFVLCWLLLIILISPACGGSGTSQVVAFDKLVSNPAAYNGKTIVVEGYYFHGFEIIVLCNRLEPSGYAEGHLIPKGELIWIQGGIPHEIYQKLTQQQMVGPTERYAKIRITGKFESGGHYGHLGGNKYQITPTNVELVS